MAERFKEESTLSDNSTIVLHPFMTRDLKLKGNELLVYAVIYGFSQDGMSSFFGSRRYIADWIGAGSLRTVDACIKKLMGKGLIARDKIERNGKIYVAYRAVLDGQDEGAKSAPKGAKSAPKGAKNAPSKGCKKCTPGAKSAPIDITSTCKNKPTPNRTRPEKNKTNNNSAREKSKPADRFRELVEEGRSHVLENCTEEQFDRLMEAVVPMFARTRKRQDMPSQKALCRKTVDELYGYAKEHHQDYAGDIVYDTLAAGARGRSIEDRYLSYWLSDGFEGFKADMRVQAEYGDGMGWSKW